MMEFYDVQPYHFFYVQYNGGGNFKLEIFNVYAVEIKYHLRWLHSNKSGKSVLGESSVLDVWKTLSDLEVCKLSATLCSNAYYNSRASYKMVSSYDVAYKIGLHEGMTWIELVMATYKWKIGLIWVEGIVKFDQVWFHVANATNLMEGDTCVLHYTNDYQKFKVVLEKKNIGNYNVVGLEHGKSIMKFFKVVSKATDDTFNLAFPNLFVGSFGHEIMEKMTLLMGDRKHFVINYCSDNNFLYGLKDLVKTYSISEDFIIFFDYVGLEVLSSGQYIFENDTVNMQPVVGTFEDGRNIDIGGSSNNEVNGLRFQITVKGSHLLQHCHGMDVKSQFSHLRSL
ncbi:hypothetical protein POM88_006736 [Heracleum sosnowskyi]|uniref:Uncharacterized protein n=1 Tax=Heracleum sosnowskyi TaxID=360622 RepID=A0AAD8N6S8_9APIA|nr:hypothetical protein POM88_006736 [Heracleum sosnowskyi]